MLNSVFFGTANTILVSYCAHIYVMYTIFFEYKPLTEGQQKI